MSSTARSREEFSISPRGDAMAKQQKARGHFMLHDGRANWVILWLNHFGMKLFQEIIMKRSLAASLLLLVSVVAGIGAETNSAAAASPSPKSYQIRNVKSGNLLRPEDANSANGTRLVLYPAQPWKCMTWKLFPAGDGVFQVKNHFTAKTFAASSTNELASPVTQVPFAKDAAARPAWRFVKLGDGSYEIVETKSGHALTAVTADGSEKIVTAVWSDQPEQKWELIETDPARLTM